MSSFTTDINKGQSLDGEALDVSRLDERVRTWKESMGLYHQENFPPKNFPINTMGEKFHDRSHILVQDYLGKSSWDFCQIYNEESNPSIFEELLTFLCAQITHKPEGDYLSWVTPEKMREKIEFLRHIGYVSDESIFLTGGTKITEELSDFFTEFVTQSDFPLFVQTLFFSSADCPDWDRLS